MPGTMGMRGSKGWADGANSVVNNSGASEGDNSSAQGKNTVDDRSGLKPNRQKGFGNNVIGRIETPSLNEMKAKQGAIVARFITFFSESLL